MSETTFQGREKTGNDKTWIFRLVPTIISLCAAMLIGWGESNIPSEEKYQILGGILTSLVAFMPLCIISNSGNTRSAQVIHYTSMAFLIIGLLIISALCIWCTNHVVYIITIGLWLLILLSIVYFVSKSNQ